MTECLKCKKREKKDYVDLDRIDFLTLQLKQAQKDAHDWELRALAEATLNGKGSEREARLMAQVQETLRNEEKNAAHYEQQLDALREELEWRRSGDTHSCHAKCKNPMCVIRRERDELRAELRRVKDAKAEDLRIADAIEENGELRALCRQLGTQDEDPCSCKNPACPKRHYESNA